MSLAALDYIQRLEDRVTVYEHNIDLNAINNEINTLKEQLKIAQDVVKLTPIQQPYVIQRVKDLVNENKYDANYRIKKSTEKSKY